MQAFVFVSVLVATVAASALPLDTPEVAAAKAQHLAAVEEAKARAWAAPAFYYAPSWSTWSAPAVVNGQVQDTPEVAAEKAKHLTILAAEHARAGSPIAFAPVAYSAYAPVVVANGQVQDTPEVAQAKAQHLAAHAEASARSGSYAAAAPVIVAQPAAAVATPFATAYAAPAYAAPYYAAPYYAAAAPIQSQYHSQDSLGQYSYGYAGGPSSKAETKTFDGVTRGSFSYIDSNGLVQSRSYVADDNGFRVAASDLPVGPAPEPASATVAVAAAPAAPAPYTPVVVDSDGHLADTVEVAAAKAAHFAAHSEATARLANAQ